MYRVSSSELMHFSFLSETDSLHLFWLNYYEFRCLLNLFLVLYVRDTDELENSQDVRNSFKRFSGEHSEELLSLLGDFRGEWIAMIWNCGIREQIEAVDRKNWKFLKQWRVEEHFCITLVWENVLLFANSDRCPSVVCFTSRIDEVPVIYDDVADETNIWC